MNQSPVMSPAAIQKVIATQFPGLLGVDLLEVGPDRVVGRLPVRPELCTVGGILHGGAIMAFADTLGAVGTFLNQAPDRRTTMVWQTMIRREDGRLCAIVSQTQLMMEPKAAPAT